MTDLRSSTVTSCAVLTRTRLVVTAFGIGWTLLALRLIQLQWWDQDQFADRAERQRELAEVIVARPGDIVDRQGRLSPRR